MVLLDVEKAFDSVWHDGLVAKMYKLKFPKYLTKMIKSYLEDRKAYVSFSKSVSETFTIPAGVPQGSILAPFLFNLFINDVEKPKDCELAIYADDTALTAEATKGNPTCVTRRLVKGFKKIRDFYAEWRIKINGTKTEFIMFSKSPKLRKRMKKKEIEIDGVKFNWKNSVKYLGVHLNQTLNFKTHIEAVIRSAKKIMSILFCLIKRNSKLSERSKVYVYKTYIRPILTYAGTIFHNCPKTYFKKLQILQNKCLRMALNAPYYTKTGNLHAQAKTPTIEDFIQNNADRFYSKAAAHKNYLVKKLGDYTVESLPFKLVHKMPKKFSS